MPNAHIRLGGKIGGGMYKYKDYYSAFAGGGDRYRRLDLPESGPMVLDDILATVWSRYAVPRDLSDLQKGLTAALDASEERPLVVRRVLRAGASQALRVLRASQGCASPRLSSEAVRP